jgi:hypothetical protein
MSIISKLSVGSFTIIAALALPACSSIMGPKAPTTSMQLQASAKVPAAEGTVNVQEGDNGNYKVALEVKHMAPPEKVASGASSYVVWLRPLAADQQPQVAQNLGQLAVNKDLEGKLNTVTPYHQFDLFVTAEPVSNTTAPTGDQLLTTIVRK